MKPFLPSDRPRAAAAQIEKAAFANALNAALGPGRTRGATAPASTTGGGWAKELAPTAVGDFVSLLPSASGSLIAQGTRVSLIGTDRIKIPKRAANLDASGASCVQEGMLAAVKQINLNSDTEIGPTKKLVCQIVCTREMLEHSDAETVFGTMMRENVAFALDAKLFSADAATDAAPAGLLNGIAGLTPSAATDLGEAARADLEQLATALAAITANVAFVMHPAQANSLALRLGRLLPSRMQIWPSLAVAAQTVIAIDPAAFVSGLARSRK